MRSDDESEQQSRRSEHRSPTASLSFPSYLSPSSLTSLNYQRIYDTFRIVSTYITVATRLGFLFVPLISRLALIRTSLLPGSSSSFLRVSLPRHRSTGRTSQLSDSACT